MNRQETIKALSVMKAAYPAFYSKQTKNDLEITVNLWETIFANDPYEIVIIAIRELISKHSGFPPDIAALRKQIDDMTLASIGAPTDEQLWRLLSETATEYGQYSAREGFQKLPPILQKYLGVPETLNEISLMDRNTVQTVVKGQFLKQIGSFRERERFENETPEEVKQLFRSTVQSLPRVGQSLSLEQVNERRNRILDQLDGMKTKKEQRE